MSDTPHSQYGYWIEPSGIIHAMNRFMGHEDWITRDGRLLPSHSVSVMEKAIRCGWIGVSISPVGESVGVRIRAGSAEKKAARSLGRIFKQHGFFDREVYTDFALWNGRDLYNHLVRTSFNPDVFPDVAADIRFTEQEIAERQEEVALAESLAAARNEGNPPDIQRLRELIAEIEDISGKAYSETGRGIPSKCGNGSIEDLRAYCRQRIELFDCYRIELQAPISELAFAMAGTSRPPIEPDRLDQIDRSLPALELLQQLKEVHMALASRISSANSRDGSPPMPTEIVKALRIVEKIETGCGPLVTSKLKLLEKVLGDPEITKEKLEFAARYYIGHELARTFSVCGGMYAKDLRDALQAIETAIPTQPLTDPTIR